MGIFSTRRKRRTDSFASRVPVFRWLGPIFSFICIFAITFYALTGNFQFKALDSFVSTEAEITADPVALNIGPRESLETIRIASFNIKTFGAKKSSTRLVPEAGIDVLGSLAKVVSKFDLVAIQEVRSQDGTPIRRLIDLMNASGGQYTAQLSEPSGDEHYTESYAFVWDQTRIRMLQNSAYVVHDDANLMYREPMVASFETRVPLTDSRRPFRFTIINAHTDPDMVTAAAISNEINVLDDVFVRVRQYEYDKSGEEDCILVGDLNVSTSRLQELAEIPNVISVAGHLVTNTRRTETYDHILIDRNTTREYTGNSGVLDLQRLFGINEQQALLLSDHMPVWAEFDAYEVPMIAPMADSTTQTIR